MKGSLPAINQVLMGNTIEDFKKNLESLVSGFREEIKGVRANRPSVAMVENLKVDYYGAKTPLSHLSSIQIKPPREIIIQVWDKDAVKPAGDIINSSDTGLSANIEGNVIRVFVPELSRERREELIKQVKGQLEERRIGVRSLRDESNREVEKNEKSGEITEDDKFRLKDSIQKETEKANREIEEIFENKKKEIEL